MTGEEVRKMKDAEMKAELASKRMRLFDLRSQTVTEKVEDLGEFKRARRDIARMLTELRVRLTKEKGPAKGGKVAVVRKVVSGKAQGSKTK